MPERLSRRAFLVAGASAAVVTACSNGKSATPDTTIPSFGPTTPTTAPTLESLVLVSFSDSSALVPGSPQRVTFGLADKDGVILTSPPAPSLDFSITIDGQAVGAPVTSAVHQQGLPRPYFPLEFTPPKAGVYDVTAKAGSASYLAHVQIPDSTSVVGAGQKMVPVDTPTVADQRGVQLLCTRTPACPLHDVTLREALAAGTPVAFMIGTPKFCQTAICGPVLDVLLQQKDQFPQIKMLHSEVYPSEADAQPGQQKLTDAVTAYGLSFEPVLYLAGPDGTIMKRIDTIFDAVELHDALTQLTA